MFQAYDAGLEAEIAYRRERLVASGHAPLTRWGRPRRSLRGRKAQGGSSQRSTR